MRKLPRPSVAPLESPRGARLGLYGFGAAGHVAIQVARHWGVEVYASTRDLRHQALARGLGAMWTGGTLDEPPKKLDAGIVFAPAGENFSPRPARRQKRRRPALGGNSSRSTPSPAYNFFDS